MNPPTAGGVKSARAAPLDSRPQTAKDSPVRFRREPAERGIVVTHSVRGCPPPILGAGRWRRFLPALALVPLLAGPARADAPRGGEVLLLDRQNLGLGGRPLLMGIDPETYESRDLARPSAFNAPRAVSWGRGKRLYVGDGPRFWDVDAYASVTAPPAEVTHPWLSYIVDLAPDGAGGLYIVDQLADPLAEGYHGALLHYTPETGAIDLVLSDARFVAPRRVLREPGGTLLLLDPRGRMRWSGPSNGALYRIDPRTHTMESLLSLHTFSNPSGIALQDPDTLLLAVADLSHPDFAPNRGGVVKIALADMSLGDTLATGEFLQPTDLVVLPDGTALVMDEQANPGGYPDARGGVFHLDLDTGELLGAVVGSTFRSLTSIELYDGPDLDGSSLEFVDVNGGDLRPGDRLRFQATLRSSGPSAPGDIALEIGLGALDCLFGTAIYAKGVVSHDPEAGLFRWSGALGYDEEVELRVDLRVPQEATDGTDYEIPVRTTGGLIERTQVFIETVQGAIVPWLTVCVDAGTTLPAPRLFTLGQDEYTPINFVYDFPGQAPRPVDVAFAPDGTLYVLDTGTGVGTVLGVDPSTHATRMVYQGAPLTIYSRAITVAHDGALLVVDPKAVSAIPGVVYRIEPVSGEISVFFTTSVADSFPNPVDICLDEGGGYVVCETELLSGSYRSGGLFLLDEDGDLEAVHTVAGQLIDPYSAVVDRDGSIYMIDRADGYAGGPSFYWVRRPSGLPVNFIRLASVGEYLLERPSGIVADGADHFLITDRESNPVNPGRGGLIRFNRSAPGVGFFEGHSFHLDLREPSRADTYRPPEPVCSSITLQDLNGGDLRPGDLLRARIVLDNAAPTPGLALGATVRHSAALSAEYQTATGGTVRANPSAGTVEWSGDLRFRDPRTLEIGLRVSAGATHGDLAEIEVTLLGGLTGDPVVASQPIIGPLEGDEFLVLDASARPLNPLHRGTIFAADIEEGTLIPFRSHSSLVKPVDLQTVSPTRVLVLDQEADPLNLGSDTGAIYELNTENSTLRLFAAGFSFVNPVRLLPDQQGGWYVLDRDAQSAECPGEGRGAILRIGGSGGQPLLVACSEAFREPADMTIDTGGLIWVADRAANPEGLATDDTGAIFAVDPVAGTVVETFGSMEFVNPCGVLWLPGQGLFLTDPGHYEGGFTGVRKLNTATGALTSVLASPFLSTPTRMLAFSGSEILLADSTSYPPASPLRGAVYVADVATQELGDFVQHAEARSLISLASVPRPDLQITRWQPLVEPSRTYRASGERMRCELVLSNPSQFHQTAVAAAIGMTATLDLDPATGSASEGVLRVWSDSLRWEGAIPAGDSVRIEYDALVTLLPGTPTWAEQFLSLAGSYETSGADTLSHYVSNATASGELLVCDAWSDPRPPAQGGIFRGELHTHEMAPVLASPLLRTPVSVLQLPGSATEVLIVDAQARPSGAGTGTLFRGSTRTGQVTTLYRHPSLRLPIAVAAADSFTAFLLDSDADPFTLRPSGEGPGAVFRIDLTTGVGAPLASDLRFWEPRDLLVDGATGDLYVIDTGNGTPSYPGGVFRVDPVSGSVSSLLSGGSLTSPRCGAVDDEGRILVMDSQGTLGGALYRFAPGGQPELFAQCSKLRNPYRMVIDGEGRVLCVDAEANPLGLPSPTGSIFRLLRGGTTCWVYASGEPFERPCGVSARFDGTPVAGLTLALEESERGVELRWTLPEALAGAACFIYRRAPEIPGSEFEILNAEAPLTGTGEMRFVDPTAMPGELYEYLVACLLPGGGREESGPVQIRASGQRARFFLARPVPNPFAQDAGGSGLTLRFGVPEPGGRARLALFDVTGRQVASISEAWRQPGTHALQWDGRDGRGARIGGGVYFLRLDLEGRRALQRLVFLR